MKLRKIQTPDKFKRLLKQFIRFAPDSHNDIHPDKSIRKYTFDGCHLFGKQFYGIAAFHQLKYFVGAALQRNMEMRHDVAAVCNELNNLIGEQVRFHG